jgi:hypothetical protein
MTNYVDFHVSFSFKHKRVNIIRVNQIILDEVVFKESILALSIANALDGRDSTEFYTENDGEIIFVESIKIVGVQSEIHFILYYDRAMNIFELKKLVY